MRHQVHNLILVTGCMLIFCGFSTRAEAGFIVNWLDELENNTNAFTPGETSSSTSKRQQPQVPQQYPPPIVQPAFLASLDSAGSMTPQSLTGSSGNSVAQAAPFITPTLSAGQLVYRLARQRQRYHPRFIKSRLFRPPRN